MAMATPPPHAHMDTFVPQQAPPYAPGLININQHYNMSASSLTEALLLLSGMYISLVQPDPTPIKIGFHAVFSKTSGPFLLEVTHPFVGGRISTTHRKYPNIKHIFDISANLTKSDYSPKEILEMLCDEMFPKNTITVFYMNNHLSLQQYHTPTVKYLPQLIESLGLPIISYDTQFSINSRPDLSVQLAPTMGQMMDVMFAFLQRFNWTDFSFLCTLSYGCQDEIASIRLKVDESHKKTNVSVYGVKMFSYNLLSYLNFTNGSNADEVKEKLKYELHKDTRIFLVHGNGAEVKDILEAAAAMGLTGRDYVWIFTSASISLTDAIAHSYPLGSFVIGFDDNKEKMADVVKMAVDLWLTALNSLALSPEFETINFDTHFSCDRLKEDAGLLVNGAVKSPLCWKYGDKIYQQLLKVKLPGDLEFDEYGVLKGNKFWIMNIQLSDGTNNRRHRQTASGFHFGQSQSVDFSSRPRGRDSRLPLSPGRNSEEGLNIARDRNSGPITSNEGDSESLRSRDRSSETSTESVPASDRDSIDRFSSNANDRPARPEQSSGSTEWQTPERSSSLFSHGRIRHRDKERNRGRHVDDDGQTMGTGQTGQEKLHHFTGSNGFSGRSKRAPERKQIAVKVADWNGHNLTLTGITWPGGSSVPPKGKPERYLLKVVTWKEDPHVIYKEMNNASLIPSEMCDDNSLPCKVYPRDEQLNRISNTTIDMCCTGLCIDLLKKISEMAQFDVDLREVPEGSYGSPLNKNLTEWNGMLGMLIHNEADMAMGALSITPERSQAVDFSVPFLQTGITIIVAMREGAISAAAFLEPYDYPSWCLILVFSVHATGASIFIFEWLSPYGLDQGKTSMSVHKFSLFRSFWLIWAMLFGASVSTDQPRGCASRFLANIWALFAVVFCASYTANLAAFMIAKDDFYDLSGIEDWRLKNPHHHNPPFKFATIIHSSTDLNIEKNHKAIHRYMDQHGKMDVKDAVRALKAEQIQAFIYDSTTLEYEVGKDPNCRLKTVGKRIAETGYGVAFPRRSQWRREIDRTLLRLQETGEIERLQKFWLAGPCHKKKEMGVSNKRLAILNFTSVFILLGGGVVLGALLLFLEHVYFRFGRKPLKKWDRCGFCSLVSLSMGQSLTFEQSVMEAIDYHKHHKCKDPLCETQLWKVKHELDIALLKISQLRKQIAHSVSTENAGEDDMTSNYDREGYPNGKARRRRQQAIDSGGSSKMDRSANTPLLAIEGKHNTEDDETPESSPQRKPAPSSSRPPFSANTNKVAAKEADIPLQSVKHSYAPSPKRRPGDGRPASRLASTDRNYAPSMTATVDLDMHLPPPSFDEAMARYSGSPADSATSSPSPPLPPPPALPPQQSPLSDVQRLSDSVASNSLPSSGDKRYEPFILDSPDSPSSSFSEVSGNHLPSPGTLSKLSDEGPSTPASPDRDSYLTSSPDYTKSFDDNSGFPTVTYVPASPVNTAQSIMPTSSKDSHQPTSGQTQPPKSSKEDDNDVNVRRTREGNNVYVNVDDILGKETSF